MTLFIAYSLIYNFHMDAWWYAVASVLWLIKYAPAIWNFIES